MTLIEILVIIGCVLIVGGVITSAIMNKKKGKTSCGCDCSKCSGCSTYKNKNNGTNTANK